MPANLTDWLVYFCVCMLIPAAAAYFLGCLNGAILISRFFLKEDVRSRGSGNAGLTNFLRSYGKQYAVPVILLDVVKMVAAVVIACLFMSWTLEAKLWGGLFCVLGHMFPALYKFKGGKGILSSGTLLIMLDWRIALVAWGTFILLVVLTRYVSLGSGVWTATAAGSTLIFYPGRWVAFAIVLLIASLVIWCHRSNVVRLLKGTESKFTIKKKL